MINSAKAVGIKLYESGSTHGVATVSNVTCSEITVQNCDYAVQIQSCYNAADTTNYISNTDNLLWILGILPTLSMFRLAELPTIMLTYAVYDYRAEIMSTKFSPVVANLHCSTASTCDVALKNFTVKPPSDTTQVQCSGIDGTLDVTCTGTASG
ncbi:hypothetical protein B0H17DRAFT_1207497 [Mycena rosella]|uniref:Uncharacterized protein n=1 Tax=Mycena rosella TaxID=1033263 RepID=A0AAD7GCE8_MYCRO|nr:hypothetical protein B0H17DRAFT_1207497 [Mycena rosella]